MTRSKQVSRKTSKKKPAAKELQDATKTLRQGNAKQAISICQLVIDKHPNHTLAYYLLATAYSQQRCFTSALESIEEAIILEPTKNKYHVLFAHIVTEFGDLKQAYKDFENTVKKNLTNLITAYLTLARTLTQSGRRTLAIHCNLLIARLYPKNTLCQNHLAHALKGVTIDNYSEIIEYTLCNNLDIDGVDHQMVVRASLSILRARKDMHPCLKNETNEASYIRKELANGSIEKAFDNDLLKKLLVKTVITDEKLETLLKIIHQEISFLCDANNNDAQHSFSLYFLSALAIQSFNNEYILPEIENEQYFIEKIEEKIYVYANTITIEQQKYIAIYCMFRNPITLRDNLKNKLSVEKFKNKIFELLITQTIIEQKDEEKIKHTIQSFSSNRNSVSIAVKAQYEESPYPRWKSYSSGNKRLYFPDILKRNFPHIEKHDIPKKPNILIAGCGTGLQAVNSAIWYKDSTITAIDLSYSSLAYAIRKSRQFGIKNISFKQGDLLDLKNINQKFDLIESVGVLHHLENPTQGLSSLMTTLSPGGYLRIALYSTIAREALLGHAETFIKDNNYTKSLSDIKHFRQDYIQKYTSISDTNEITGFIDFYNTSGCRDMLFHTHEHRFNLIQLKQLFSDFSLEFIGFEQSSPEILSAYYKQYPDDKDATNLTNWHAFEQSNPSIFIGMYKMWLKQSSN